MTVKNTLLIVDDYEFNRVMLCDMFPNYDIIEAENGFKAMEEYEKHKDEICCIISDIMMPVMDGFGLLDYLNKNKYNQKVPVFIISADTSSKALTKAFDLGAQDIIAKPFNINFVRKRIENTIELFRLREYVSTLDIDDDCFDNVSAADSGSTGGMGEFVDPEDIAYDNDFSDTAD